MPTKLEERRVNKPATHFGFQVRMRVFFCFFSKCGKYIRRRGYISIKADFQLTKGNLYAWRSAYLCHVKKEKRNRKTETFFLFLCKRDLLILYETLFHLILFVSCLSFIRFCFLFFSHCLFFLLSHLFYSLFICFFFCANERYRTRTEITSIIYCDNRG